MLGALAGDIIGSRFEGHPSPPTGFALFHPDCRFTDDSVCTLAVANALLGKHDFAASLRTFVRRHPNRGYGGMFLEWASADDAPAYGSWGNGAPMRVSPVGWLASEETNAWELAAAQAAVSHDHPDAVAASQAIALTILWFRQGVPSATVRQRVINDFGYDLTPERAFRRGGFDISAAGTVPLALTAAFVADDWESAVRTAVCLGGDTDNAGLHHRRRRRSTARATGRHRCSSLQSPYGRPADGSAALQGSREQRFRLNCETYNSGCR